MKNFTVRFLYSHGFEIRGQVQAGGSIQAVRLAKELIAFDYPHWEEVLQACEAVATEEIL